MEDPVAFDLDGLQALIDVLADDGMEVLGPRVRRGVIAVGPVASVDDLPVGWSDRQGPATYRLERDAGDARFSWAVGPQSWKPLLHPPRVETMTISDPLDADHVRVTVRGAARRRRAFLGVRPCELAAVGVHDTVLRDGAVPDPVYRERRDGVFLVVVNCTAPAATCFCASMGTGPAVLEGHGPHDLALTELAEPGRAPRYVASAASDAGTAVLERVAERVTVVAAAREERELAASRVERAEAAIVRRLDSEELADLLCEAVEEGPWAALAERCLACANCTSVCPTCFCTSPDDVTDLDGAVHRSRIWDSCFGLEFSRVGREPVRRSVEARYRQWLVHKLGTWRDQFGESGCVGCGRCITWCPVGIDLTAGAARIREWAGS